MANSSFQKSSIATPVTVPLGGTGGTTFTDAGVILGNGTGTLQVTSAGTSGQVLTSNGAGVDPTFQAAAGGVAQYIISTLFEEGARFLTTSTGAGVSTFTNTGLIVDTSATAISSIQVRFLAVGNNPYDFLTSPNHISFGLHPIQVEGTDYNFYWGNSELLVTGAGNTINYANKNQYGFKRTRVAAGAAVTSATNANGTTEKATSFTLGTGSRVLHANRASTEIKFFDTRTLVATHTTELPSASSPYVMIIFATNLAVATQTKSEIGSFVYSQNAE